MEYRKCSIIINFHHRTLELIYDGRAEGAEGGA